MKKLAILAAIVALGIVGVGCGGGETTATKEEETSFRNPPKEPPPAAVQGMQEGMKKAQEQSNR